MQPTTTPLVADLHGTELARRIRRRQRSDLARALEEAIAVWADFTAHPERHNLVGRPLRVAAGRIGPAFRRAA